MELNTTQYVYCFSNPSLGNNLKIGYSRQYPTIRAQELSKTSVPTPFKVEFIIHTENGSNLESKIHKHLRNYRVTEKREFFNILIDELKTILVNEMGLELDYNILNITQDIIMNKMINDLNEIYNKLKKETCDFVNKLEKNGVLDKLFWEEDNIYQHIRLIESEIKNYDRYMNELNNDLNGIKDRDGIKTMKSDNNDLKNMMLHTKNNLDNLLNKSYKWVF